MIHLIGYIFLDYAFDFIDFIVVPGRTSASECWNAGMMVEVFVSKNIYVSSIPPTTEIEY